MESATKFSHSIARLGIALFAALSGIGVAHANLNLDCKYATSQESREVYSKFASELGPAYDLLYSLTEEEDFKAYSQQARRNLSDYTNLYERCLNLSDTLIKRGTKKQGAGNLRSAINDYKEALSVANADNNPGLERVYDTVTSSINSAKQSLRGRYREKAIPDEELCRVTMNKIWGSIDILTDLYAAHKTVFELTGRVYFLERAEEVQSKLDELVAKKDSCILKALDSYAEGENAEKNGDYRLAATLYRKAIKYASYDTSAVVGTSSHEFYLEIEQKRLGAIKKATQTR